MGQHYTQIDPPSTSVYGTGLVPLQPAVIFDICGTLADTEHRDHHLQSRPKDWAAFNAAAHLDPPKPAVLRLARILHEAGYRILLVTGREDAILRSTTTLWLAQQGVIYDELYMRPTGDHREDTIVKLELLHRLRADGYDPWLVVEDRKRLVKMWREQGLTCLQCAEGDF